MQVHPYLFFDGNCEEALEFYQTALGARVDGLVRFKDAPEGAAAPGTEEKVMHARLLIGETTVLASDGQCSGQVDFQGFALSLTAPDAAEAERLFAALSDGGEVEMPLAQTFFAPRFGMVVDRFSVTWMVLAAG